jgi:hypothetical protein
MDKTEIQMTYYRDNVLKIPNATPETRDAAQYMIRHGRKQYNLCGEFTVAFCMQDEAGTDDIDAFLDYWQAKDLKWYQSVFQNGLGRTTGVYDLDRMLSAYGVQTPSKPFAVCPMNPLGLSTVLKDFQAIIGVQIDHTGYLVGKGIPHWVVLDRLTMIDSLHAICDVYNPFTNSMEPYSWKELMTSTGSYKSGIWVRRSHLPDGAPAPSREVPG